MAYPNLKITTRQKYPHLVYHPTHSSNPLELPPLPVWDIWEWHTPATDYPEKQAGNFRIHHGRYTRGLYRNWGVRDYLFFKVMKPIPITSLQELRGKRWRDWMVDDPPQQWAMEIYAREAYGKVLTTGLGLGLIVHELVKNPSVTQITVVEKAPEVVELIKPYLPDGKVKIVTDDFYHFVTIDDTEWDHIIVDLWPIKGKKEKLAALYHRVLPMIPELKMRYPKASITFHGFQTVSDIKPVSEEMIKLIEELRPY